LQQALRAVLTEECDAMNIEQADTGQSEKPNAPRRIVLTGFMGSGKSTVGPLLAARLGWRFLDVDEVIEVETGATIAELFSRYGEGPFRDREAAMIAKLVADEGMVLALGGGAIERAETRDLLLTQTGTLLIHLEVSLETTMARCAGTEQVRPILADKENLARRYRHRIPLYRAAHISIPVDALNPHEVVEAIVESVGLEEGRV
jgi:shikimate kinase